MNRSSKKKSARKGATEQLLSKPAFWMASTLSLTAVAVAVTIASNGMLDQVELTVAEETAVKQQLDVAPADFGEWARPASAAASAPVSTAVVATVAATPLAAPVASAADAFAQEHLVDENTDFGFTVSVEQEARYKEINANVTYPSLETRMIEMQARRNGDVFDADAVLAALASPTPWTVDDSAVSSLDLTVEEQHDGREFLNVDRMKIESLVPGDVMELPLAFEGGSMQMEVERVEVSASGAVTWHGRIMDFEEENQVTITQGAAITVGGITTPNGVYMVESRAESGWIVPTGTLFKNTEEEDGVFPPEAKNS